MSQKRLIESLLCCLILAKLWAFDFAHSFLLALPGQERIINCFETQTNFVVFAQQMDTNDIFVVKVSKTLELQSIRFFNQLKFTKLNCVKRTRNNGFILVGYEILQRQSKIKIALLDEQLNVVNEKILPISGADQWAEHAITLQDGYLLVGGHKTIGSNWYQALVIRLDENLEIIWSKTFGGSSDEWFSNLCESNDGFLCVGSTESYGSGQADFLVVHLFQNGYITWWKVFGGPGWERAIGITQAKDGIMVVGPSNSFTKYNSTLLIKVNSRGQKIYQKTIDLSADFTVKGIVSSSNKDLFVIYGEIWNDQFRKDLAYLVIDNQGEVLQKKIMQMNGDQNFCQILPLLNSNFLVVANTENSYTSDDILLFLLTR